jgi:hypothetical protein
VQPQAQSVQGGQRDQADSQARDGHEEQHSHERLTHRAVSAFHLPPLLPQTGGLADGLAMGQQRVEEPAVGAMPAGYARLYSWIAHMFPSGSAKKQ